MAELVVLGAGLSGTLMAYELVPKLRKGQDRITVIGQGSRYHFVPSNPWVAIGWREKQDIEVDLEDGDAAQGHPVLRARRAPRLPEREPDRTRGRHLGRLRLSRRRHRAGPRLRRNPGTWPERTDPVDLPCRSRDQGKGGIRTIRASRRGRSWSARSRAHHASARPTNSPSSSIPSCESAACATAFR